MTRRLAFASDAPIQALRGPTKFAGIPSEASARPTCDTNGSLSRLGRLAEIVKRSHENACTMLSNVANVTILTGTARMSVGASPRTNTREPSVRYECAIVERVFRYGLSSAGNGGGCEAETGTEELWWLRGGCGAGGRAPSRELCMRVLMTSNGNVNAHPATPATPPARRKGTGESASVFETSVRTGSISSASPALDPIGGEKTRRAASYCERREVSLELNRAL